MFERALNLLLQPFRGAEIVSLTKQCLFQKAPSWSCCPTQRFQVTQHPSSMPFPQSFSKLMAAGELVLLFSHVISRWKREYIFGSQGDWPLFTFVVVKGHEMLWWCAEGGVSEMEQGGCGRVVRIVIPLMWENSRLFRHMLKLMWGFFKICFDIYSFFITKKVAYVLVGVSRYRISGQKTSVGFYRPASKIFDIK